MEGIGLALFAAFAFAAAALVDFVIDVNAMELILGDSVGLFEAG